MDDPFKDKLQKIILKSEEAYSDYKAVGEKLELELIALNELLKQLDVEQLNNLSLLQMKIAKEKDE